MSEPIKEYSIVEAKWLCKWVIVNPDNISERMEFDSVNHLAQHLFLSKQLITDMAKERDDLLAEVERLRKAVDDFLEKNCSDANGCGCGKWTCVDHDDFLALHLALENAAKEGKQS